MRGYGLIGGRTPALRFSSLADQAFHDPNEKTTQVEAFPHLTYDVVCSESGRVAPNEASFAASEPRHLLSCSPFSGAANPRLRAT